MNNPLRVIVIEDEYLLAETLADVLCKLGCDVQGSAANLDAALQLLDNHDCDFAVVDLNLQGQLATPILDRLYDQGIPFLLATGAVREEVPARYREAPRVTKPYDMREIRRALGTLADTCNLACWAKYRAAANAGSSGVHDANVAGV